MEPDETTSSEYIALAKQALEKANQIFSRDTYYGDRTGDAGYHVAVAQVYATLAQATAVTEASRAAGSESKKRARRSPD
jgi:hypothetical protein